MMQDDLPLAETGWDDLGVGVRVRHPKHGEGKVTGIEDGRVAIEFDDGLTRRRMSRVCHIFVVEESLAKVSLVTTVRLALGCSPLS